MMIDLRDLEAVALLSAFTDACRCFTIFSSPDAAMRPVAAWSMLPLGFGVSKTLEQLAAQPIEDADQRALHSTYFEALAARHAAALAAWTAHKETRTHVH